MSNLGRSHSQPYVVPRKLSNQQLHPQLQQLQLQQLPRVDEAARKLLLPDFSVDANTFEVEIERNSLGLGFSITGGSECPAPWTHLGRILEEQDRLDGISRSFDCSQNSPFLAKKAVFLTYFMKIVFVTVWTYEPKFLFSSYIIFKLLILLLK